MLIDCDIHVDYSSLSDLLPEMEFHTHNKVQLTVALGLGIVLSWTLTLLEQAHLH